MAREIQVLHDKETKISNGNELVLGYAGYSSLSLHITGTSSNLNLMFEGGCIRNEELENIWQPIPLFNYETQDFIHEYSGVPKSIWVGDITGVDKFRCRITSIEDGNITVVAIVN